MEIKGHKMLLSGEELLLALSGAADMENQRLFTVLDKRMDSLVADVGSQPAGKLDLSDTEPFFEVFGTTTPIVEIPFRTPKLIESIASCIRVGREINSQSATIVNQMADDSYMTDRRQRLARLRERRATSSGNPPILRIVTPEGE